VWDSHYLFLFLIILFIFIDRKISLSELRIAYDNVHGSAKGFIPMNINTNVFKWFRKNGENKKFAVIASCGFEELVLDCKYDEERDEWIKAIQSVSGPSGDPAKDADELLAHSMTSQTTSSVSTMLSSNLPSMPSLGIVEVVLS